MVGQFGRMLKRRSQDHRDGESLVEAAPAAALDTVGVAVSGYAATPRSETILFNLLAGFLGSFALIRLSTWGSAIAGGRSETSASAIATSTISSRHPARLHLRHRRAADRERGAGGELAIPMGIGMGLTFDEAALLLDLRDVYWTREGLFSVQLSLGATAILSIAILTLRMLRACGQRTQESWPASTRTARDRPALNGHETFFRRYLRSGRCRLEPPQI